MNKLKIFKEPNDYAINSFLEQSKGKIKAYNPIVIEYNDKNINLNEFNLTHEYIPKYHAEFDYSKREGEDVKQIKRRISFNRMKINLIRGEISLYYNEISVLKSWKVDSNYNLIIMIIDTHASSDFNRKGINFELGYEFWQGVRYYELNEVERACEGLITKIT